MKNFKNCAAQGDLVLRRIAELPAAAQRVKAENGYLVCAHSETQHNHAVLERPGVDLYQDGMDMLRGFLVVQDEPAVLEHQRSFDTHESLKIEPGIYELRRQREWVPDGFRRAAD